MLHIGQVLEDEYLPKMKRLPEDDATGRLRLLLLLLSARNQGLLEPEIPRPKGPTSCR